jgi:hypothetical protein
MKISRKNLNILIESFLKEQDGTDFSEPEEEPAESVEDEPTETSDKEEIEPEESISREDFEFTIRFADIPIDFKVEYVEEKPVPSISSDDNRTANLIAKIKPIDYLSLAFEKMKELKGYEDEDRKSLFNKIAYFLKDYDVSIKTEDPMEIFKSKMQDRPYIQFALDNIKKLLTLSQQ